MATIQKRLLALAMVVDPRTKDGQVFQDSSSAVTITGAANNGSGLIRITAANHGRITGEKAYIASVGGTTEANNTAGNPSWTTTSITSNTLDLVGSTFTNAYTSGGTITGALIGSVDGAKVPRQRLLDIYNQARMALFGAIDATYSLSDKITSISGTIVKKTDLTFAAGVATKPTGYIQAVRLSDVSEDQITIAPFTLYRQTKDRHAVGNRIVYEYSTTLEAPSTSTTIMPNAATYILRYFGITDFTLSDVLGGSVAETFNDQYHSAIIELAEAIFNEQGQKEINALALKLIGAK